VVAGLAELGVQVLGDYDEGQKTRRQKSLSRY